MIGIVGDEPRIPINRTVFALLVIVSATPAVVEKTSDRLSSRAGVGEHIGTQSSLQEGVSGLRETVEL